MNKVLKNVLIATALTAAFGTPALAADEIKIGLGAPMTGGSAAFGKQLQTGAQAAIDAINAKGGVNGKQLKLVTADDACDPKQAVAAANRLVDQEKVTAVIGHFCSSSTIPASEIYDEANILNVTPASTNPKVTERDLSTILRTCGRDDQQGEVDAKFMKDVLKVKRAAIINDKDTYGVGLANATRDAAKKLGIEVVLEDGVTRGERDYNALVTKIKGANVDAVFFGGLYAEAGQPLDGFVEFTLKDDARQDPPITEDALVMLGILTAAEYKTLKDLTVKVSHLVKAVLRTKGIELYDIKLEFGRIGADQSIAVIDEISGGNMRAYQGDKYLEPLVLEKLILE